VTAPGVAEHHRAADVHGIEHGDHVGHMALQMRATATLTTTGQSFAATSIQVLRIREGRIVLFRDFANPRILEDAIGEPRPES
jgi:ketosteroid isomerase-like protein